MTPSALTNYRLLALQADQGGFAWGPAIRELLTEVERLGTLNTTLIDIIQERGITARWPCRCVPVRDTQSTEHTAECAAVRKELGWRPGKMTSAM